MIIRKRNPFWNTKSWLSCSKIQEIQKSRLDLSQENPDWILIIQIGSDSPNSKIHFNLIGYLSQEIPSLYYPRIRLDLSQEILFSWLIETIWFLGIYVDVDRFRILEEKHLHRFHVTCLYSCPPRIIDEWMNPYQAIWNYSIPGQFYPFFKKKIWGILVKFKQL